MYVDGNEGKECVIVSLVIWRTTCLVFWRHFIIIFEEYIFCQLGEVLHDQEHKIFYLLSVYRVVALTVNSFNIIL